MRHKDTWGNSLSGWQSGAGDEWGHNTKERSGIHGMTYMYQRWYSAETGTFLSKAPYNPYTEHQFGFAESNPASRMDPRGESPLLVTGPLFPPSEFTPDLNCVKRAATTAKKAADRSGLPGAVGGEQDAYRHCLWMCLAAKTCGSTSAAIGGWGNEIYSNGGFPWWHSPGHIEMDLHNNKVGLKLGQQCGSNCDKGCRSKLNRYRQELWVNG